MPTHPHRRQGFSLLELMIVIVIIGVLSGIIFIGFSAIRRSQDQRNTKAALEVGRTLFNNYVSSARAGGNNITSEGAGSTDFYLRLRPNTWQFNDAAFGSGPITVPPVGVTDPVYLTSVDFFNVPHRSPVTVVVGTVVRPGPPLPMDVPVVYIDTITDAGAAGTNWMSIWQLQQTAQTIRRMRSSTEAKSAWSSLRESQVAHLPPIAPDTRGYDFILDTWGRPLLFVPGSGVRGVQYGELASTNPKTTRTSPPSWYGGQGPTVQDAASAYPNAIRSPDGRGFWMSAGPDGFFDTQDDNLYSFDN